MKISDRLSGAGLVLTCLVAACSSTSVTPANGGGAPRPAFAGDEGQSSRPGTDGESGQSARTREPGEKTPADDGGTDPAAKVDTATLLPQGPLLHATYGIDVSVKGIPVSLCSGEIQMVINGDLTMSIPNATLACGLGVCSLDVAAIVASLNTDLVNPKKLLATVKEEGGILRIAAISGGTFTPPRPMLLAALAKKPSELASIDEVYRGSLANPASGESATGEIHTKTLEASAEGVRWSMESSGWDGINRARYALLKRLEVEWKLKPISVPAIVVTAGVTDILTATGLPANASAQDIVKMCTGNGQALGSLVGAVEKTPLIGALADKMTDSLKASDAVATLKLKRQTVGD